MNILRAVAYAMPVWLMVCGAVAQKPWDVHSVDGTRDASSQPVRPGPQTMSAADSSSAGQEQTNTTPHAIRIGDRTLGYTATASLMPIADEKGKMQAEIFYIAYMREGERRADRPITFAFNGGPGASSIWLHLAALGPRRAVFAEEGKALPARYRLVDNEYTWLDFTDLVFIDPPQTGFSRVAPGIDPRQFFSLKSDVQVIAEFIRLFVTREDRWLSPKFLAGESYGSTRAAALASHLQRKIGMTLDGLVLISTALDFQTIMFSEGNDLPHVLYVPAYAATAWYHGKLSPVLQNTPLEQLLAEVEQWATTEYRLALAQGDALSHQRRQRIVQRYAAYTGLPESFIDWNNLRISNMEFTRHILRDQGRIVGIMDGRVTGLPAGRKDFITDPSLFLTLGPLMATLYDYVRTQLGFRTDRTYEFLNMEIAGQWNWGSAAGGFPSVLDDLRQAMSTDPRMRVLLAAGYYDLNTSYLSQKYSIDHLLLDPTVRRNVRITYYPAGHQLYTYIPALKSLTENAAEFYEQTRQEEPVSTISR